MIEPRKIVTLVEEVFHEFGPPPPVPLKLGAIAAVVKNPYAGRYERIRSSQRGPLGPFGGARTALNVGIDQEGLHVRMFILFRLNCRALFIPWRAITVSRGRSMVVDVVAFHVRQAPKIGVRIYGKAGEVIQARAGPVWPAEMPRDVVQR